jgi:hypothetical protein
MACLGVGAKSNELCCTAASSRWLILLSEMCKRIDNLHGLEGISLQVFVFSSLKMPS